MPVEAAPEFIVDVGVTMADTQHPTQPRAFAASSAVLPAVAQHNNFNRPLPTGPRLALTTPGQLHPPHQSPISLAPSPNQDPNLAVVDAPIEEESGIQLPEIKKFELPNPSGKKDKNDNNPVKNIDNTVNHIQSHTPSFLLCFLQIDKLLQKSYTMRAEYDEILKATRKAIYEQEMAEIELSAARMRREVADSQLEKARLGLLGIDYDGISGLIINE